MIKGNLHSIQTLGAVDGPGLRTVVILQGCPLKCKFCHSVDTTLMDRGEEIEAEELVQQVIRNRPYWRKYLPHKADREVLDPRVIGGVTITGGDPVAQPAFAAELLKRFKEEHVHTVLETSLFTSRSVIDMFIDNVDLWMISLKHMDAGVHEDLVGRPMNTIHENLSYLDGRLAEMNKKKSIRIRYVVIPEITNSPTAVQMLGTFVRKIESLECIELLPYVTMGRYKWIELFGAYPLEGVPEATSEDVGKVEKVMKDLGVPTLKLV